MRSLPQNTVNKKADSLLCYRLLKSIRRGKYRGGICEKQ